MVQGPLYSTNCLKQIEIIMGRLISNKKIKKEIQGVIQKQNLKRQIIENDEKHMPVLSYLK